MIRIYVILGLVIASLGALVYVQTLRASNERLKVQTANLEREKETLTFKITTDAAVKVADDARADKAEAALKSFKETADADIAALKSPDRLCFDGDDTRRLQHLFGNEVR